MFYPDIPGKPVAGLSSDGFINPVRNAAPSNMVRMRFDPFTPYDQCVIFEYESATGSLVVKDHVPDEWVRGPSSPKRLDTPRILQASVADVRWRSLVLE